MVDCCASFLNAEQAAEFLGGLNSRTVTRWSREGYPRLCPWPSANGGISVSNARTRIGYSPRQPPRAVRRFGSILR